MFSNFNHSTKKSSKNPSKTQKRVSLFCIFKSKDMLETHVVKYSRDNPEFYFFIRRNNF